MRGTPLYLSGQLDAAGRQFTLSTDVSSTNNINKFVFIGTFTGIRTILIVDFTGIYYLSYAFGWTSFFQGVSSIPVPPLAGKLVIDMISLIIIEKQSKKNING